MITENSIRKVNFMNKIIDISGGRQNWFFNNKIRLYQSSDITTVLGDHTEAKEFGRVWLQARVFLGKYINNFYICDIGSILVPVGTHFIINVLLLAGLTQCES